MPGPPARFPAAHPLGWQAAHRTILPTEPDCGDRAPRRIVRTYDAQTSAQVSNECAPAGNRVDELLTVRVALAQLNTVVGDIAGNTRLIIEALERARDAGAALTVFPGAGPDRLSAGGPAAAAGVRPRQRTGAEEDRRPRHGGCGADRLRRLGRRLLQRRRGRRRRARAAGLPQAVPAELRRLRRGPLLPRRRRPARRRPVRPAGRPRHLRGHLVPGPRRQRSHRRRAST